MQYKNNCNGFMTAELSSKKSIATSLMKIKEEPSIPNVTKTE